MDKWVLSLSTKAWRMNFPGTFGPSRRPHADLRGSRTHGLRCVLLIAAVHPYLPDAVVPLLLDVQWVEKQTWVLPRFFQGNSPSQEKVENSAQIELNRTRAQI
eukprot:766475-Hanusia_phi.AAC.1